MTDEQMDARLHRAGQEWRSASGPALATHASETVPFDLPHAPVRAQRRPWLLLSAALVVAALVAGGGFLIANLAGGNGGNSSPTPAAATIEGRVWWLVKVTDANGRNHPVLGTPPFEIKRGRLLTSDGCHTLSGQVGVDSSTLDLTQVASTANGCLGNLGATAAVVDLVLSDSVSYEVNGTRLSLSKPGAGTLLYTRLPRSGPADLCAVELGPVCNSGVSGQSVPDR